MLESAERRVVELEAPLQAPAVTNKIAVLPSLVELYLTDLKGSLGRDTERARSLLAKLIGQVTLRRNGQRLVSELQGNLSGLLELDNQPLYKGGSGGPILIVSAVPAPRGQLGGLGSPAGAATQSSRRRVPSTQTSHTATPNSSVVVVGANRSS